MTEPIKSKKDGEDLLQRIVGARLTSVQFVLNYLILGFDEKGALTTLIWPEISDHNSLWKFGTNAYRDRLCDLIEQIVEGVAILDNETIIILFSNQVKLIIPLKEYSFPGERAILTAPDHVLYVW